MQKNKSVVIVEDSSFVKMVTDGMASPWMSADWMVVPWMATF